MANCSRGVDCVGSEIVARFLRRFAYKTGDFTLASGSKSNEFLNIKNAVCRPDGAALLGHFLHAVTIRVQVDFHAVAGVAVGGIPLASALSAYAWRYANHFAPTLIVRKEKKDHGIGMQVDGLDNLRSGDNCIVLLEDVWTTGESTAQAVEALHLAYRGRPLRIAVVAICDREAGAREMLARRWPDMPLVYLTTLSQVRAQPEINLDDPTKLSCHADFCGSDLAQFYDEKGWPHNMDQIARHNHYSLRIRMNWPEYRIEQTQWLLASYGMQLSEQY